jgi:DNA topoisomerase-1
MASEWILREGSKRRGFRYRRESGDRVTDRATLARIDALRVPPAWRDVHVAASPQAAVQAWGIDARGRKQYRYHDRSVRRAELRKYYRVRRLAHDLPRIRAAVDEDFRAPGLDRRRVAAAVVRLISQGFFRVGNERYTQENRTFGITTLHQRHLTLDGDALVFRYVGKRGIRQRQVVVDPHLVAFAKELLATPGRRLFRYEEEGEWRDLTARDVNQYLHEVLGVPYTAKDFRTWGGTLRAATVLAELGPAESEAQARKNVLTAVRLVAAELGNTPAICRASYVHPIVIARYLDGGEVIEPHRTRSARRHERYRHAPEERALIAFLDRHFPERRHARPARRQTRRERRADAA